MVDLPQPTLLDYLFALAIFLLTALPYLNSLEGNMCYDDKVAVGGNPDVVMPNVTLWDIATHDFWGNDILRRRPGGWTHDSWRPLVTLSFRANHMLGGLKTPVYHATNILIHSLVAVVAYALAWLLLRRPLAHWRLGDERDGDAWGTSPAARNLSLQAAAAALLFGLHPVHSECVANITSRADPMAALFCLGAAIVYLWGRSPEGFYQPVARAWLRAARLEEAANEVAAAAAAAAARASAGSAPPDPGSPAAAHAAPLLAPAAPGPRRRPKAPCCCYSFCHLLARGLVSSGQWGAAFLLVVCGIMCKETSLTMPLLLVLCDLGMALPAAARLAHLSRHLTAVSSPAAASAGAGAAGAEAPRKGGSRGAGVSCASCFSLCCGSARAGGAAAAAAAASPSCWGILRSWLVAGFTVMPITRSLASCCAGALIYYLRIIKMSNGYSLQSFANEMHNPLANIKDAFTRRMGKAFVQSWAMTKLVVPVWLSHEHNAHQPVVTLRDPRNLLTLCVASAMAATLAWAFASILYYGAGQQTQQAAPQSPVLADGAEGGSRGVGAGGGRRRRRRRARRARRARARVRAPARRLQRAPTAATRSTQPRRAGGAALPLPLPAPRPAQQQQPAAPQRSPRRCALPPPAPGQLRGPARRPCAQPPRRTPLPPPPPPPSRSSSSSSSSARPCAPRSTASSSRASTWRCAC